MGENLNRLRKILEEHETIEVPRDKVEDVIEIIKSLAKDDSSKFLKVTVEYQGAKGSGSDTYIIKKSDVEEDFDGTLSDLGEPPTAALSMVDARGGSRKLAGYAGLAKNKKSHKKPHKKSHKKHESASSLNRLTNVLSGETLIEDGRDYGKPEPICPKLLSKRVEVEKKLAGATGDEETRLRNILKDIDSKIAGNSKKNESITVYGDEHTLEYLEDRKKEIEDELKNPSKKTEVSQLEQELCQVCKELERFKAHEDFKEGDEVEVVKGANKGLRGIAKSSDVDLKDKKSKFVGEPKQQANIKPKIGDVDQYHVIDDKEKIKRVR